MNSKAAFLDRDGVINRKVQGDGYVTRWDDMHFLPNIADSIASLNRAGFKVIVITNQRCVAKGLITSQALEAIHQKMCEWLAAQGAQVDGVYYCPHEKEPTCNCRKPAPGLLLMAARSHHVDLGVSWMIGDSEIDVEAGRNAGCRTVRLLGTNAKARSNADVVAPSLIAAVQQILRQDEIVSQQRTMDIRKELTGKTGIVIHGE